MNNLDEAAKELTTTSMEFPLIDLMGLLYFASISLSRKIAKFVEVLIRLLSVRARYYHAIVNTAKQSIRKKDNFALDKAISI